MRVRLFGNSYSLAAAGQSGFDRVLGLISLASKDRGWVTWFQIYHFASYFRSLIFGTTIYSDFEVLHVNLPLNVPTFRVALKFRTDSNSEHHHLICFWFFYVRNCVFLNREIGRSSHVGLSIDSFTFMRDFKDAQPMSVIINDILLISELIITIHMPFIPVCIPWKNYGHTEFERNKPSPTSGQQPPDHIPLPLEKNKTHLNAETK